MGVWNTKPFDNDAACDWLAGYLRQRGFHGIVHPGHDLRGPRRFDLRGDGRLRFAPENPKLTEELWDAGTPLEKTLHPDIFRLASFEGPEGEDLQKVVQSLKESCRRSDTPAILHTLTVSIPGASIREPAAQPVLDDSSLT